LGPGIRCFFDPWIWERFFWIPDPPTHIFENLLTILGEKVRQKLFSLLFVAVVFVRKSGIRDPASKDLGSAMDKNQYGILDKHPESATM
jgi:hypothetical protein